jgi:hypothetical protein
MAIGLALLVMLGGVSYVVYPYASFSARFRRSRPALDAYAAQVAAKGSSALASPPARLGYFHVGKIEPLPNGFLFQSSDGDGGPFDWSGLAYSTSALPKYDLKPDGSVKQAFAPIAGNWYDVFRP